MTDTNEIAVAHGGALALDAGQTEWTSPQIAALAQLGIVNAPQGDQLVFLHQAQRTGLDPFARQIYMIGRNQKNQRTKQWETKYTIQASIDGLRIVAQRSGLYRGQTEPQWCGPDGAWKDVWLEKTPPAAARIGVLRADFDAPTYGIALWTEFAQYAGAEKKLTSMWRTKGVHMLSKCAEALALRKAFPHDLSGIYTPEEMSQADEQAAQANRQAAIQAHPGESIRESAAKARGGQQGPPGMASQPQQAKIGALLREAGITSREHALAGISKLVGREVGSRKELTLAEASAVIEALEARTAVAKEQTPPSPDPAPQDTPDAPVDVELTARDVWADLVDGAGDMGWTEDALTAAFSRDHSGRHPSTASVTELDGWGQRVAAGDVAHPEMAAVGGDGVA